ncbi:protein tyrosine phosphatase [Sphingobacterium hungaricum]
MNHRPNILVICGRNKRRSRTAEHIFKNSNQFAIRSAGLSPQSDHKLTEKDLAWADLIFVMEFKQKSKIKEAYRHLALADIEILQIPDDYDYLDPELIELLTDKMSHQIQSKFNL